jgi:ankyrin repeat protein
MYKNPMNKQPFKPQPFKQQQPRLPPYINRTIIPTKEIDPSIISTLLLKVSTDEVNILELGNFIMTNGITTNDMLNESGESILHIIISNENLSEKKKVEIIKYLDSNFSLLLSSDINGRTPLHLAVQNQLYDVVNELINAGHDMNAIDNAYKTPLHYAVIGKHVSAPSKVEEKLIPDNKIKIKSNMVKNLTDDLVKFMQQNDFIKRLFTNQYNTLLNARYIFTEEIRNKIDSTDLFKKMIDILENPKLTPDDRNKKIFEISAEVNKDIKNTISTKLDSVKKEIKLESTLENGWGPSTSITDKIMEYPNLKDFKEELENEQRKNYEEITAKNTELFIDSDTMRSDNVTRNFNVLYNDLDIINEFTKYLLFVTKFYTQLDLIDDGTGNKLFANVNGLLINVAGTIEPFLYQAPVADRIYNPGLDDNTDFDVLTDFASQINDINYNDGLINIYDKIYSKRNKNEIRYSQKIEEFLNDFDNDINLNNIVGGAGTEDTNQLKNAVFDAQPRFYNTRRLEILIRFIKFVMDNRIRNDLEQLIQNLNNYSDNILIEINSIIRDVLSAINILPKIFEEYKVIINKFKALKNNINESPQIFHNINGNNYDVSILNNFLVHLISEILSQLEKNEKELKNKLVTSLRTIYSLLDKIINYVNLIHSIKYINTYFNDFNEANIFGNNTDIFQNIFYSYISKLTDFFKSYDDVEKMVLLPNDRPTEQKNKKKLIEKYLLQFNKFNLNLYINDPAGGIPVPQGRNGYISDIADFANLDVERDGAGNPNLLVKYDEAINDPNNYDYTVSNPTRLGVLQKSNGGNLDKHVKSYPIIAKLFDKFFNIQKYLIIRHILDLIYTNLLDPAAPPVAAPYDILQNSINKFKTEIDNTLRLNPNDNSILLISIGRLLDKIFVANLENIINITTNEYGYRYVRNILEQKDTYDIVNITEINKINIDELNFEDIQKSITKLFKRFRRLTLYNYAEDIMTKQMKDKNMYKIMGSNVGDNTAELFYKYNIDILKKLLEKGASIHKKDKDGNTPLMLALLQNNDSAVQYILNEQSYQNISVYNKDSKNRFGIRPYDVCAKSLNVVVENFDNELSNNNLQALMKEVNAKISGLTKIKHNMRFHNVILRMLIYLLNHDLYSMLNSYKFQQDRTFHDYFFTKITTQIDKLPLLRNIDGILASFHGYIDKQIKSDKEENDKKDKKYKQLEKEKELLEEEKMMTTPPNINQQYRHTDIDEVIADNTRKQNELEPPNPITGAKTYDISKQNTFLKKSNLKNLTLNQNLLTNLKTININPSSDILTMYNNLIDNILRFNNNDYRTYMTLWEKLFELQDQNNNSDETQIMNKILEKLKNILSEGKKNIKNVDETILTNINISIDLLNRYISDYFELPFIYNGDNYVLDRMINIFEHIVQNTILVNLYHMIAKLLRVELISKNPNNNRNNEQEYYEELDKNVINILINQVNDMSVNDYIFDKMPRKIIKITLGLFESDDDDDKKLNLSDLFAFIDKLLESNTVVKITKDDKIMKTLNEHVYRYFKEYIDVNIKMMKKLTDAYLSMIISLKPKLNMYQVVMTKAKGEKI